MESGSWCSKGAAACVMHSAASSARAIIVWARDLSTATLIDATLIDAWFFPEGS